MKERYNKVYKGRGRRQAAVWGVRENLRSTQVAAEA
jgi:hypothetical protein